MRGKWRVVDGRIARLKGTFDTRSAGVDFVATLLAVNEDDYADALVVANDGGDYPTGDKLREAVQHRNAARERFANSAWVRFGGGPVLGESRGNHTEPWAAKGQPGQSAIERRPRDRRSNPTGGLRITRSNASIQKPPIPIPPQSASSWQSQTTRQQFAFASAAPDHGQIFTGL